jgi:DNA-binding transcriptional LysR family regulator
VPRIVKKILKTAPNVRLRVVQADSQHVHSLLEGGEVDLAIGAFPLLVKGIRKQRLFSTSYMGLPAKTTPDLARHPRFKNLFGNNKSPSPPLAAGTPIKGSNGRRTGRCATTTRQSRYCWTYRSLILLTSDPPMNSEQSTGHRPEVVRRRGRPVRGCPRPCGHRSSAPWASWRLSPSRPTSTARCQGTWRTRSWIVHDVVWGAMREFAVRHLHASV